VRQVQQDGSSTADCPCFLFCSVHLLSVNPRNAAAWLCFNLAGRWAIISRWPASTPWGAEVAAAS
jgi:hypothetical protein